MKKHFLTPLIFLFGILSSFGQTTGDWTTSDCLSINHNLYTYLNNEEVVIMEFAMGCGSCTNAATYLLNSKDKYAVSNPGKVKVFYMDYWPGNDCAVEIATATTGYVFDGVFGHCVAEKDSYFTSSVSPMPGVVIAAGSFHQIIYQTNSFANADTLAIEQAITDFFATVGINENSINNSLSIYPNPSTEELVIHFENQETEKTKISVYNMNGQFISLILNENLPLGEVEKKVDVSTFPKGVYYVTIATTKESINKKIIIL